ncbi:hypothetical protein PPTG_24832 [Phytophthora nicotianae INRA-310]|uniref:Uncharacterized protein n=1 Tax=Phytophthora nicotianae (strain INRA-310) TaxID=761204 RepID=W2PAW3_PHYN3|nr:hypothetical protein PPTG_24832 [Phytophthora nicotianae INRA-310]ETM97780.1 hypothetical protein PPTG_24832 [Phytophthora nicotianae INRA-310]
MLRDQSPATESFASYSYRMDQMDLAGGTNGGAVSKSDVDSKRILAEEGLVCASGLDELQRITGTGL